MPMSAFDPLWTFEDGERSPAWLASNSAQITSPRTAQNRAVKTRGPSVMPHSYDART